LVSISLLFAASVGTGDELGAALQLRAWEAAVSSCWLHEQEGGFQQRHLECERRKKRYEGCDYQACESEDGFHRCAPLPLVVVGNGTVGTNFRALKIGGLEGSVVARAVAVGPLRVRADACVVRLGVFCCGSIRG
jgi:hypothetical protein